MIRDSNKNNNNISISISKPAHPTAPLPISRPPNEGDQIRDGLEPLQKGGLHLRPSPHGHQADVLDRLLGASSFATSTQHKYIQVSSFQCAVPYKYQFSVFKFSVQLQRSISVFNSGVQFQCSIPVFNSGVQFQHQFQLHQQHQLQVSSFRFRVPTRSSTTFQL